MPCVNTQITREGATAQQKTQLIEGVTSLLVRARSGRGAAIDITRTFACWVYKGGVQLFYSSPSPFARKVRVAAREKGLAGGMTEVECNPFADPPELKRYNQLKKVPTLVHGEMVLYDSPVICEYLDARKDGHRLIPRAGAERWRVLRAQALADGMMDAAVALTLERRRPPTQQSLPTQERWRAQIVGAVATMEEQLPDLSALLNIGHIAFAAALGYLDFRYPETAWRKSHPALATWYDPFALRPAMQQTQHSDSSYKLPVS